MNNKETIINKIKNLKYIPKFTIGDVAANAKYKTVVQILEVEPVYKWDTEKFAPSTEIDFYRYKVAYIVNPLTTRKNKQSWKDAHKLDTFYDKVCPKVARVLYGELVIETKGVIK